MSDPIIDVIKRPQKYKRALQQLEEEVHLKITDCIDIIDFLYNAYKLLYKNTINELEEMLKKEDETGEEYIKRVENNRNIFISIDYYVIDINLL